MILKASISLWRILGVLIAGLTILLEVPSSCPAQAPTESVTKLSQEVDQGPEPQDLCKKMASFVPKGWEIFDRVKQFTPQNLYDQIDGRAEFFLAYDIIRMTFACFISLANVSQFVDLSVYDMGSSANAFGVFSSERSPGETPVRLGRKGYRSGASYFIWTGRYYIRIIASESSEELNKIGMELARKLIGFLADSCEPVWELSALPKMNRVPDSEQYVKVDAMGLDFMRDTYLARYRTENVTVTAFLSKRDTPEAAKTVVSLYQEYAREYG